MCWRFACFALLSWLKDIFHDKKNDAVAGIIQLPMGSMYGIFAYTWVIFMINVGKYTIHGSYGL